MYSIATAHSRSLLESVYRGWVGTFVRSEEERVWTMSCWEEVAHATVSSDGLTLMLTMWSSSPTATAHTKHGTSFHVHTISLLSHFASSVSFFGCMKQVP